MKSKLAPYEDLLRQWVSDPSITWQLVVQRLEALNIQTSETAVRRFCKANNIVKVEGPTEEKVSSVYERAAREVEGQRTKEDVLIDEMDLLKRDLSEAKQLVKRLQEKTRLEDRIATTIESALSSRSFERPVLVRPKTSPPKAKPHELVLGFSDAHYGEVVRPEEALGLKYDPDIAKRRIETLRDSVIRIAQLRREAYPIQKLTIAGLGDLIGGNIHEELEVTNQINMADQCSEMAHIIFDLLVDFDQEFENLELIIMPGNHPRIHKKPRYKGKYENWEYIMGKMVQSISKHALPDVTVTIPQDMIYIHTVLNYRIAMMHGDGVKSASFAGIPFYGLKQRRDALQSLLSMVGQARVNAFFMGHFHQYLHWGGECDVIINPSIKGGDEFGIGTRISVVEAEQVLLEWHEEHGLVGQNRIKLGHIN